MQKGTKVVVAVALIVVLCLIVLARTGKAPDASDAAEPVELSATDAPVDAEDAPEEAGDSETDAEDEAADADGDSEAAGEDAGMYEGALAGLTEEEIGALALSEEGVQPQGDAGEGAVD